MQQKKFSNLRSEMVELGEIHMIYEKILQKNVFAQLLFNY